VVARRARATFAPLKRVFIAISFLQVNALDTMRSAVAATVGPLQKSRDGR
jgi:hypothetical protein